NVIEASECAVTLSGTTDVVLRRNVLAAEAALELERATAGVLVHACDLRGTEGVRAEPDCWAELADSYVEGSLPWDAERVRLAPQPYGEPPLPIRVQPADPADRNDHGFRWY